ncbi:unnamed protein product [Didymodactylos carnosus]|uniref:EamA domain-containing protein n=2 Tax=Didymodactylos carnosus TaxID=1234261 RepID=A0A8S2DUF5_9BILA|nr:unnamed protein product [Didymodactylos carnosus]CAF3774981.1 unnamed protein product [Didymodactylos carnosus]
MIHKSKLQYDDEEFGKIDSNVIKQCDKPLVQSDINSNIQTDLSLINRFSGILYTLLTTFLFTLPMFITKQLNIDVLDALLLRCLVPIIISIIYIKKKHINILHGSKIQHLFIFLTCLFAIIGYVTFFLAYNYIPLPNITTIRYTQVIWTSLLMTIVFRDKPSVLILIAIPLTIFGVLLVTQPTFSFTSQQLNITNSNITLDSTRISSSHSFIGFSLALFCSIAQSITTLLNKKLYSTFKVKHVLIILEFSIMFLIVLFVNLIYKSFFLKNYSIQIFLTWQYLLASVVCLLMALSGLFMLKAIKREHPSIFTIVQSSDIVIAIVLQNLFTDIKSNWYVLLGSLLVLTSILLVGGYKLYINRPHELTSNIEDVPTEQE